MDVQANIDGQIESDLHVRPLGDDERPWLEEHLARSWGSCEIVNRGHVHDAARLPALVCLAREHVLGVATFHIRDGQCELVTLNVLRKHRGVGSALLAAIAVEATRQGCHRVWLVATNDNLNALRFYQRRNMRLVAVHRGAVDDARSVKSSIPVVGDYGIPMHDELELELSLR
ncbi:MAG TPA: GNAT family N-acetyltransferase [Solirubrobacteraceae bacterium]|nr:GNAT family N-acetyltransferase [Solirubrobacteraceae bacterium]